MSTSADLRGLVFIAAIGAVWWLTTSVLALFPEFVLPSPGAVWRSLRELAFPDADGGVLLGYGTSLWGHIAHSVGRLLAAFGIAAAIAVPLGVLLGTFRTVDDVVDPVVQCLRPIPPIAWTPLAILWFGIGLKSLLFIIILGALWPILVNTVAGVREVREILLRAGRSLGANQIQTFVRIVVPASMPLIFTGMRSGITVGWWMIVPAEMIASDRGLGFLIMRARENGHTHHVIAGIIAIALVGYCFQLAMVRLGRTRLLGGT